jgi:hypothetical protein
MNVFEEHNTRKSDGGDFADTVLEGAMCRRSFLKALPIAGVGMSVPVQVEAETQDTEILRLGRLHWDLRAAAKDHVYTPAQEDEDEQLARLFFDEADFIEREMMSIPSSCAADVAAKMLVAHGYGESSCLYLHNPVWVEAIQLMGINV